MSYLSVEPAYGRDYKTKAEIETDWIAGKDFRCTSLMGGGKYVNKEDGVPALIISCRYAKQRKVHVFRSLLQIVGEKL